MGWPRLYPILSFWASAREMIPKGVSMSPQIWSRICLVCALIVSGLGKVAYAESPLQGDSAKTGNRPWAEIQILDAETGRGIPLVELETVNNLVFVTDNAGRIAFQEPGLMGQEIFFTVKSHGYEMTRDGFGFPGTRFTPRAGERKVIKLKRINLAERIVRLTGEGLYRDSQLLGYETPLFKPLGAGHVSGQDSVQATVFQDKVYWFWGDTNRMGYPLGLFRMAGATTPVPGPGFDPSIGIAFDYFVDKSGFARAMMPIPERPEGVVWVFALCVVPDANGKETLCAHYTRRKGLAEEIEHGIAVFDPEKSIFIPAKTLPLKETWRHPSGHPIPFVENGKKWLLMGSPNPNVRVPATLEAILDPSQYEAFTCAPVPSQMENGGPLAREEGKPDWRWQKNLPPTDSKTEHKLVREGKIPPENARFCPVNVSDPKERIVLHSGSVRWNPFRKKWILLAGQIGGKSSLLGEVYYSEADAPTGPFPQATKVLTHEKQTFYNVCHHDFLDREGGRFVHFEGTYTNDFSGNPWKTPRYNYNQILYRLDLGIKSPSLK